MKPPNGSWDPSRDQDAIIAQVAQEAARAIRSGNRRPQTGPEIDARAPTPTQASPESFTRWLRSLPWWVWALIGFAIGGWLNKH